MRVDPEPVVRADDARVHQYLHLTDMDLRQRAEPQQGIFMAEGHLVIERCASQGLRFVSVLTSARWLDRLASTLAHVDVDVFIADEHLLESITGFRVHRGALAVVERPPMIAVETLFERPGDVLVLEDLVDPTNVGLAIRSAVVQGIDSVLLSPRCADPLYRRAVKSSMGAVLRCQWSRSADWPSTLALLARRRTVIAVTPHGDRDLERTLDATASEEVALLVGSEGPGLSDAALAAASLRCRIPMATTEDSLNVAAATAVACYVRARTRNMSP